MGRFHRHDDESGHHHHHSHEHEHTHADGTVHSHSHDHAHSHDHDHDHAHSHDHEHAHRHDEIDPADHHLGDHSGYDTGRERIAVLEDIFAENDNRAAANRAAFDEHGVHAVNLMSAPGSGKTAVLERTLQALSDTVRIGIIEGDIETSLDAQRLDGYGAQISLLNTGNGFGGECHLDAPMVASALTGLNLADVDLVLIENVGNLVCPAEFEVGEHRKAMVYSVTEGEDKPLKYPVMFRSVDAIVINKTDLLPYLDFDMDLFRRNIAQVNPTATIFEVSAKTGDGLEGWVAWLHPSSGQS